jgi:hypothetical protein
MRYDMAFKNPLFLPFRIIDKFADRIFAVAFAILFAQFPQFVAQYIQRLGGHIDELARIVNRYRESAKEVGKTLEQFIDTHLQSNTPDFVHSGRIMIENLTRLTNMTTALADLKNSSVFAKPFIFFGHIDLSIAKGTLSSFVPGIPTTLEGALYACIGIIFGMIIYFLVKSIARLAFSRALSRKDYD